MGGFIPRRRRSVWQVEHQHRQKSRVFVRSVPDGAARVVSLALIVFAALKPFGAIRIDRRARQRVMARAGEGFVALVGSVSRRLAPQLGAGFRVVAAEILAPESALRVRQVGGIRLQRANREKRLVVPRAHSEFTLQRDCAISRLRRWRPSRRRPRRWRWRPCRRRRGRWRWRPRRRRRGCRRWRPSPCRRQALAAAGWSVPAAASQRRAGERENYRSKHRCPPAA